MALREISCRYPQACPRQLWATTTQNGSLCRHWSFAPVIHPITNDDWRNMARRSIIDWSPPTPLKELDSTRPQLAGFFWPKFLLTDVGRSTAGRKAGCWRLTMRPRDRLATRRIEKLPKTPIRVPVPNAINLGPRRLHQSVQPVGHQCHQLKIISMFPGAAQVLHRGQVAVGTRTETNVPLH